MTILELYEQFCKNYCEDDYASLITLLQDNAALLSMAADVFPTQEAFEKVTPAERPKVSYIKATKSWYIATTDPITMIEDKEDLFLRLFAFGALLSGNIPFLNKIGLNELFSATDNQIISQLLSGDEIKALLPWAIMDGAEGVLHALLKQLLLKTKCNFNLDEPLADGLTALELLSKVDESFGIIIFIKRMMLFYAAAWDYFVGEAPTVDNISQLPCSFTLEQQQTITNIAQFFTLQPNTIVAKDNPFFSERGLCDGFCYLCDLYAAEGRLDYYFMTIALLNIWNGTPEQLDKPFPVILPQALFYRTLRELFQQWTNDVLIFQNHNVATVIFGPGLHFYGNYLALQSRYFRLVKSEVAMRSKLVVIENQEKLNTVVVLTEEKLEEFLKYFIQMPNSYIHVIKNGHATSIHTLQGDGRIAHFNPNHIFMPSYLSRMAFLSYSIKESHPKHEDIVEGQFLFVYRYESPMHKETWGQKSIFLEAALPATPAESQAFQRASANGFTHLHVAVLVQDTETIRKILAAGVVDASALDCYGRRAIDIAVENAYREGTELLLADPSLKTFWLREETVNKCIQHEREDFVLWLIAHQKVDPGISTEAVLRMSSQYNGTKIEEDIRNAFLQDPRGQRDIFLTMVQIICESPERRLADAWFQFMKKHLSPVEVDEILNEFTVPRGGSYAQSTWLHRAIIAGHYAFAQFLIEQGADLNVPIQRGIYDRKTARQLLEEHGKLELIPEKDRTVTESLQIYAARGLLFFSNTGRRIENRWREKTDMVVTTFHSEKRV